MKAQSLFALAFHAYAVAGLAYLIHLIRPWRPLVWMARGSTGVGLLLHAWGLLGLSAAQGGMPRGLAQGVSVVAFLLLGLGLGLDLRYRSPVLGAFTVPLGLLVWLPALWLRSDSGSPLSPLVRQQVLLVHITAALLGLAAFGAAVLVGLLYLLMERQMKGKRFGLLFERLPSLQVLDEVNRRLVLGGFIALTFTLVIGAFFVSQDGPFWAWHPKEIATVGAWLTFAALLVARLAAGWRGKRVVWITVVGFALLVVVFFTSYSHGAGVVAASAVPGLGSVP